MKNPPEVCVGKLAGRFKFIARKPDGTERVVADWFDNLITNDGLNRLGVGGAGEYARVGSGSAAPVNANTTLQTTVASTNVVVAESYGAQPSAPYYGWTRRTYRFAAGTAAGNLSEVGVGWGTGNLVFSRALILDPEGNPTTITILSDEVLDVVYELRIYPTIADQTFNVTIGGVTHACVVRPASVNGADWGQVRYLLGSGINNGMYAQPYAGPIGTIEQNPSGSASTGSNPAYLAYSNNSLERVANCGWGLTEGNIAGGGIGAITFQDGLGVTGKYQIGFTPKIAKDGTKVLTLQFKLTWGRYTP